MAEQLVATRVMKWVALKAVMWVEKLVVMSVALKAEYWVDQ